VVDNALYKSTDGGRSLVQLPVSDSVFALLIGP
jgi:hypothetical protein